MFRFYKIGCKKMKAYQILIFLYFQVNRDLEYTYVLSNCTYYSHNISNFLCKSCFEHHIDQSISNLIVIYFYYTKVIEITYSTYQKPNGGPNGLPFYLQNLFIYFFMHMSKFASHKLDFR
jgi:hypothetical protein